jgi:hypothetical protein
VKRDRKKGILHGLSIGTTLEKHHHHALL